MNILDVYRSELSILSWQVAHEQYGFPNHMHSAPKGKTLYSFVVVLCVDTVEYSR